MRLRLLCLAVLPAVSILYGGQTVRLDSLKWPVLFESATETEYVARTSGYSVRTRSDGFDFQFTGNGGSECLRVRLVGARIRAHGDALDLSPTRTNYLIGNDASGWRKNVVNFQRVR